MKYYKLLAKWGYPHSCFIIGKIYPEIFKQNENANQLSVLEMQQAYPNDWQEVPAGDYFVQEGKMPEYFAIKRVANDPLWQKYISWLNTTYNTYIKGNSTKYPYYGFGGKNDKTVDFFEKSLTSFKNTPVELTLEQWDKIVNKTMKEEFKLPENWYIDVTDDNVDMLNKWYKNAYCTLTDEHLVGMSKWNDGGTKKGHNPKGITKGKSYDFGTKITTEQFIKYVLKEDVMEEFKLPKKWCVLSQGEDTYEKYLQPYLLELNYSWPSWDDRDYYYHFSPEEVVATKTVKSGFTEITFEQFIKYVLNQEVMKENNKEIIGWKLKDSCEQYKQAALTICNTTVNWENSLMPYDIRIKQTSYITRLEKAGVLELWFEPVYSQKFKVGDWVYITNTGFCVKGDIICGDVVKIASFEQVDNRYDWYVTFTNGTYGGFTEEHPIDKYMRLATPEETKAAQIPQITINGYKGEFFDNYVKFGCAEIDKNVFKTLYLNLRVGSDDVFVFGNKHIESVTIGKGTFTREQIKQIAEYYLNKK